jgi:hypothetical protein
LQIILKNIHKIFGQIQQTNNTMAYWQQTNNTMNGVLTIKATNNNCIKRRIFVVKLINT